ncbi:MAG: Fe-S cluster assembly protein SufD [Bdellovibrionota bacterium]
MSWEVNYLNFKNSSALDSLTANEKRQKSFETFIAKGLPTKRDEAWKYTSLTDFKSTEWRSHPDSETHLTHEQMQEVSKKLPSEFLNFVFVNGVLHQTLSDDADDLIEIKELDENDFIFDDKNVEERLLNLAQSFLNKKISLSVIKNKVIDRPVQVLFIQTSANAIYSSEKLNIQLAENSEMKLIVHSMSFVNSTADAINLNIDISVENSARLTFIQLQNEDLDSFHFSQCQLNLASSAQVLSLVLSLGNKLVRNYYHLKFSGENASAAIYGLGVIDGSQHLDNYTFIQHATGNNQSIQHYKSILSGHAHSAFRGRVFIEPNAQKADSEQLNNNLLLTRTAQAESIPQLEIFADDVKAGHGATFGQLNKDEIFYFLSRGINQYQAVKMLSYGFAKVLVHKVENQDMQNYLISALNQKLEHMVQNA